MADDYIQRVPFPLNKTEETKSINNINSLLNTLENLLKDNSTDMNELKIMQASAICELMINLLLKKKHFKVKHDTPLDYIIEFSKTNNILPDQCCSFLEIIKNYKSQSTHNLPRYFTSYFLNAFMNYISWFNLNYSSHRKFDIDGCCNIIYLKYNTSNNRKFNSIYSDIYGHFEEKISTFECPYCRFTLAKGDKYCPNCGRPVESDTIETKVANKLNELKDKYLNNDANHKEEQVHQHYTPNFNQEEILNNLNQQNEEIITILETLSETVEGMDKKLDNILNQLNHVQSHTEKLIKTAVTEEEIDRIIQVHTTQCVENIMEYQNNMVTDENYYVEKENLIESFGLDSWKKLSNDSKSFLITSKFMYNHLSKLNKNFDYSGIVYLSQKHWKLKYSKDFSRTSSHILIKNSIKITANITQHCFTETPNHYSLNDLQWEILHLYYVIKKIGPIQKMKK